MLDLSQASGRTVPVNEVTPEDSAAVAERLLRRLRGNAPAGGVPTGLADLDHVTRGLMPGALWALTGSPGSGKSTLATTIARAVAVGAGLPVLLLTRRDHPDRVVERVLAAEAEVALLQLQHGQPDAQEWQRLEAARERLTCGMLHVAGADEPASAATALAPELAPRLMVVDDVATGGARAVELAELQALAYGLHCTVVAVLTPEPRLAPHIAEEEAALVADVVLRVRDRSGHPERSGETDLMVTHHRRGPVSTIVVHNQMPWGRFVDPR